MSTTAKVDTSKLMAQVKRLAYVSSRRMDQILNQVALNAIGRATNDTKRVEPQRIKNELGQFIKVDKLNKQGKSVVRKGRIVQTTAVFERNFYKQGPRLALIINARRRKHGLPGLEGAEMAKAVAKVLKLRIFSSGFDRSGWFAGMRELITAIQSAGRRPFIIAQMKGIAAVGQPKGEATPAKRSNWKPTVTVRNNARAITIADAGALQRGMDAEAAEIGRHVDEMMKKDVDEFNNAGRK